MREEQAIFNLKIKKKSGLSINPDILHFKDFSSGPFFPSFRFFSLDFFFVSHKRGARAHGLSSYGPEN